MKDIFIYVFLASIFLGVVLIMVVLKVIVKNEKIKKKITDKLSKLKEKMILTGLVYSLLVSYFKTCFMFGN